MLRLMLPFKRDQQIYRGLFYLLILFYTVSNLMWLRQHDAPPISDSVYYVQGSQKLIQALKEYGWSGFWVTPDLLPYRPPLQSLFGTVALTLIDSTPDSVFFLNIVWMSATVWLVFYWVSRMASSAAGLMAAAFLMSNAFLHEYLSMFETEVPMMTVTTAAFFALYQLFQTRKIRYAVLLGFLLAAGMLLKWIFFFLLLAPVIWTGIRLIRTDPQAPHAPHPLYLGFWIVLIPSAIALPWYIYQLNDLIAYQSEVSLSNLYTPFGNDWDWRSIGYYPHLLLLKLKWLHVSVWLFSAGCFAIAGRKQLNPASKHILTCIAASILIYWIYFSVNAVNLPQKYLLPLQPLLALTVGIFLQNMTGRGIRAAGGCLLLMMIGVYCYQTWGIFSHKIPLYEGNHSSQWLEPQTGFFEYPKRPPRRFHLPHQPISRDIAQSLHNLTPPIRVTTIPWLDRFNAFNLSVWLNMEMPQVSSNGLNQYRIVRDLLFHDFLITSHGPSHREKTHRDRIDPFRYDATIHVSQVFRAQPDWFMKSHQWINAYTYKDRQNLLQLYKRVQLVTPDEAQFVIGSLIDLLLPYETLWDELMAVWNRLNNPEAQNRALHFQKAFVHDDPLATAHLAHLFQTDPQSFYAYERNLLYRLAQRNRLSSLPILQIGPVLGWHPLDPALGSEPYRVPFHAYPVIPYPRDIVSGYFFENMNGVVGEFISAGERLLALAPAANAGDAISITRLFTIQDINFTGSDSIIRQFQPLEDQPNLNNLSKGIHPAAGDLTGDAIDELLVGQTDSPSSQTAFSVLNFATDEMDIRRSSFVGFPPDFRGMGGVRLCAADLDGDGKKEIIAAANANGFHLSVILPRVENGGIQGFLRPQNSVIHIPPLETWRHDDPVYLLSGEWDQNSSNGDEILLGIDRPGMNYRIIKIHFQRAENGSKAAVMGMRFVSE